MIVLDTHVLVWWVGKFPELSQKAKRHINEAQKKKKILISSISVWEIYLLIKRGRLKLTMDTAIWIKHLEKLPFVHFIPVDNDIASRSVTLPDPLHEDPADRIIIATALSEGAVLITKDKRIQQYPHVQTLW